MIGVAVFTASLFPERKTDIGNRKTGVNPPEVVVTMFQQSGAQMLADTTRYTFSIEIAYIAADPTDRGEIQHALFQIMHELDIVQSDAGSFRCKNKNASITDGVGHITANVSAWEQAVPTDAEAPIIQQADQIIQKAETEVNS